MDDSEIHAKEAELSALRKEAAQMVATASAEGRTLTREEDSHVLSLLSEVRSLEDEIHRLVKRRTAS